MASFFDTNSHLFQVLLTVSKAMSPFTPFFSEMLYQNLKKPLGSSVEESVHYCSFPEVQGEVSCRGCTNVYLSQLLTQQLYCWTAILYAELCLQCPH